MLIALFLLCFSSLQSLVVLNPDPVQGINSADNFALRQVYFFLQTNDDGSITLQVQPPPFVAADATLLQTSAHIDVPLSLKTYSASELKGKTELEIDFTLHAYPNTITQNGYYLYGAYQVGTLSLDTYKPHFFSVQSYNVSTPYSLNYLYDENVNPDNGQFAVYSDFSKRVHWFSLQNGQLFTNSFTDNYLFLTREINKQFTKKFRINVDISQINLAAPGTYSVYFFFQMNSIPVTDTFEDQLQFRADFQVEAINYLYNSILFIVGDLQNTNALYTIGPVQTALLQTNKALLEKQYTAMVAACTKQWQGFAKLSNLSTTSQTIIADMLTYLAQADEQKSQFTI